MKKRLLVCWALAVLFSAGAFAKVPKSYASYDASPGGPKTVDLEKEKAAVIKAAYTFPGWAVDNKNLEAMKAVVSQGEDFFMFMPNSKDTTKGYKELTNFFPGWMDPDFRAIRTEIRDVVVGFSPAMDAAWFSCLLEDCTEYKGVAGCWKDSRYSAALAKREGRWVVVQSHFSFAVDKVLAERELERREAAGLASLPEPEDVVRFASRMPTGVAVSKKGRIFFCFPRWGYKVPGTVVELMPGKVESYPDAVIAGEEGDPAKRLVSVQSVVMDGRDRLWALDTGLAGETLLPGGAKLVCFDLEKNKIVRSIPFPNDAMIPGTYLNDVRFDLGRGQEGTAYITDSSSAGPNGIFVVDLATGRVRRRLAGHVSVLADKSFQPIVEGSYLLVRLADGRTAPFHVGADGIALAPDGKTLYYCPLSSRRLYAVATDLLANSAVSEARLAAAVRDLGEKPASDGLEMDGQGNLYATAYEHNAVFVRRPSGAWETLAWDPRLLWPDSLAIGPDGYLYVTANQLHRQGAFHNGRDQRRPPYEVFKIKLAH
jgi:sugar lactone lactonase YvrE/ketosteroid isomerase-like protein